MHSWKVQLLHRFASRLVLSNHTNAPRQNAAPLSKSAVDGVANRNRSLMAGTPRTSASSTDVPNTIQPKAAFQVRADSLRVVHVRLTWMSTRLLTTRTVNASARAISSEPIGQAGRPSARCRKVRRLEALRATGLACRRVVHPVALVEPAWLLPPTARLRRRWSMPGQ